MKKYFYLFLLSATFGSSIVYQARAQNNNVPNPTAPTAESTTKSPAPFKIARVEDDQIATLRNLRSGAKMLVYLGASAEAVQADPTALKSLQDWIKSGG